MSDLAVNSREHKYTRWLLVDTDARVGQVSEFLSLKEAQAAVRRVYTPPYSKANKWSPTIMRIDFDPNDGYSVTQEPLQPEVRVRVLFRDDSRRWEEGPLNLWDWDWLKDPENGCRFYVHQIGAEDGMAGPELSMAALDALLEQET